MITRRDLLLTIGAASLALPRWGRTQPIERRHRLGWIALTDSFNEPYSDAFVQRLGELGFVEGRNLTIERRHGNGKLERMAALPAELGKLKSDVYFGGGSEATLAALTQAESFCQIWCTRADQAATLLG